MRKPRYYYESNFYHVMIQGDEKKYIFKSDKNKKVMIELVKQNAFRNNVNIISYCVMGNHMHILVFCPKIERLSKMMSQCNTSFGLYYSKKREVVGHVFRDRFRTESIYTKEHLISCIKYIHNNPVKAKMCERPCNYPFSSYHEFNNIDKSLMKICDLDENELKNILEDSYTITRFLDEEYTLNDAIDVFNHLRKEMPFNNKNSEVVSKMYIKLKEVCRISDDDIAKIFGLGRTSLWKKLKENGVK